MKSYGIIKMKAQMFANERQEPVYIANSKRKNDYCIMFPEDLSPDGEIIRGNYSNHEIIETVYPETATL